MAKKKEKFKKEQSLEQRRKAFLQTTIGEAVILGFMGFYASLTISAIMIMDKKATLLTAPTKLGSVIMDNPVYFVAVFRAYPDKLLVSLGAAVMLVGMLELLVLIFYFYNKSRIHSNLDTLKGSTIWANPKDISRKYADCVEDKKKKGIFARLFCR